MVAMTEFHSAFIGERPEVVTLNLGAPLTLRVPQASNVSFGFPNLFRYADFLPTAVLPTGLSIPAPTYLEFRNCR